MSDPRLIVDHFGSEDAAVFRLSDDMALVESVDDPFDYGRIAAANALSGIYAMGAQPISALSFVSWIVK
jgi:selenide,water dikinase